MKNQRRFSKLDRESPDLLSKAEQEEEVITDAKERQIYDPIKKVFDYTKRRVTDLRENDRVTLYKEVNDRLKNELGILRELVMREFSVYKSEIEEGEKRRGVPLEKRRNQEDQISQLQRREA